MGHMASPLDIREICCIGGRYHVHTSMYILVCYADMIFMVLSQ